MGREWWICWGRSRGSIGSGRAVLRIAKSRGYEKPAPPQRPRSGAGTRSSAAIERWQGRRAALAGWFPLRCGPLQIADILQEPAQALSPVNRMQRPLAQGIKLGLQMVNTSLDSVRFVSRYLADHRPALLEMSSVEAPRTGFIFAAG
jgi:hypothetical protein